VIRPSWRRLGRRLKEPFPATGGNSIVAIDKGDDFFERMRAAIRAAGATVDVEMYLWDDDLIGRGFVDSLCSAAARGLRVRVLVDDNGAKRVVPLLQAVSAAGGDVRVFNPLRIPFLRRYFHRTHKKLLICDGSLAFTGGAGFSQHWSSGRRREGPWHDRMFEMHGPVVRHLVRVFESDHFRWRETDHGDRPPPPDATLELSMPGRSDLRVLRGWPDARDFPAELLKAIRASKTRVLLGSPYFIPPPKLISALSKALKRGVEVRLCLPSGNYAHPLLWHASRRHYAFFLRRGARVFEFVDGFYHAKLAVIDDGAALVGSSNLDYWSWNRNAEIDLLATDAPTVEMFAAAFESDVARSRVVTLREMTVRGAWTRVKERMAGWVQEWL
jgi:cardiolipin synthase